MLVLPDQWTSSQSAATARPASLTTSDVDKAAGAKSVVHGGPYKATVFDGVAFGVCSVLVGAYYGWNAGLSRGFGIFMAAYWVGVIAFFGVVYCIAEVSSFFPFGGGSFGYVRCILSPLMGFLAGTAELIEYLLFVVSGVYSMGDFCTTIFRTSPDLEPVWWALFFALSVFTQAVGGWTFWMIVRGFFIVSSLVIVWHFFSVIPGADGPKYVPVEVDSAVNVGMVGFMEILPPVTWMFFCVEAMVLTAEDVDQPNKSIPKATVQCWWTLFVLSTMAVIACTCAFPGSTVIAAEGTVFASGFMNVYDWSPEVGLLMSLPANIASSYVMLYSSAKLMASMASSNVLPPVLGRTYGPNRTPIVALFACFALCFGTLFILKDVDPEYISIVLYSALLNACFVYVALGVCYYICKERYSNLERKYTSVLGIWGAVACVVGFLMIGIAVAFFYIDYKPLWGFLIYTGLCVAAYKLAVRRYEFFSDDEVTTFMKAYVINANLRRKQDIKKRAKQRIASMNSSNLSKTSAAKKAGAVAPASSAVPGHVACAALINA